MFDQVLFFSVLMGIAVVATGITGWMSTQVSDNSWTVWWHKVCASFLTIITFVTAAVVDNAVRQNFKATPLFWVHAAFILFYLVYLGIGLWYRGTKYPVQHRKAVRKSVFGGICTVITGLMLHYS